MDAITNYEIGLNIFYWQSENSRVTISTPLTKLDWIRCAYNELMSACCFNKAAYFIINTALCGNPQSKKMLNIYFTFMCKISWSYNYNHSVCRRWKISIFFLGISLNGLRYLTNIALPTSESGSWHKWLMPALKSPSGQEGKGMALKA